MLPQFLFLCLFLGPPLQFVDGVLIEEVGGPTSSTSSQPFFYTYGNGNTGRVAVKASPGIPGMVQELSPNSRNPRGEPVFHLSAGTLVRATEYLNRMYKVDVLGVDSDSTCNVDVDDVNERSSLWIFEGNLIPVAPRWALPEWIYTTEFNQEFLNMHREEFPWPRAVGKNKKSSSCQHQTQRTSDTSFSSSVEAVADIGKGGSVRISNDHGWYHHHHQEQQPSATQGYYNVINQQNNHYQQHHDSTAVPVDVTDCSEDVTQHLYNLHLNPDLRPTSSPFRTHRDEQNEPNTYPNNWWVKTMNSDVWKFGKPVPVYYHDEYATKAFRQNILVHTLAALGTEDRRKLIKEQAFRNLKMWNKALEEEEEIVIRSASNINGRSVEPQLTSSNAFMSSQESKMPLTVLPSSSVPHSSLPPSSLPPSPFLSSSPLLSSLSSPKSTSTRSSSSKLKPRTTILRVTRGDWGVVALEETKKYGVKFAVLNAANAKRVGGAYTSGVAAQEENMHRRTSMHYSSEVRQKIDVVYEDKDRGQHFQQRFQNNHFWQTQGEADRSSEKDWLWKPEESNRKNGIGSQVPITEEICLRGPEIQTDGKISDPSIEKISKNQKAMAFTSAPIFVPSRRTPNNHKSNHLRGHQMNLGGSWVTTQGYSWLGELEIFPFDAVWVAMWTYASEKKKNPHLPFSYWAKEENRSDAKQRIRSVLDSLIKNSNQYLVGVPIGCGAFGNPAGDVVLPKDSRNGGPSPGKGKEWESHKGIASMFYEALFDEEPSLEENIFEKKSPRRKPRIEYFKVVTFAIYTSQGDVTDNRDNYPAFRDELAEKAEIQLESLGLLGKVTIEYD